MAQAAEALPLKGTVLITVSDREKTAAAEVAKEFAHLGFKIMATSGTQQFLARQGIASERIHKMSEGRPNIVDAIKNRQVHLLINTPIGKLSQDDDSYIRKNAIKHKIPYITTIAAAMASAKGIAAMQNGRGLVKSLQEYHQDVAKSPSASI